ncbi:ABC transporter ATP-binding protein [Oceaniglobus ichthyenteri]|uniref:ABC transporter ATP-binding protein n=1 Tax=Oceaniglobus ichthyenteri TaxID=2136177 RepID=UPI00197E704F|nr:ABC transporter ATP-binding protein [Oceaniglobus ichthyenteri]
MRDTVLQISDLKTCFDTRDGMVTAVDGVSLSLNRGECLGVVGESGSGKSVTFASVMGLIKKPGFIANGSITFEKRELVGLDPTAYRKLRGKEIAMTMQDALTALNPAYTVSNQIIEVLLAHDDTLTGSRKAKRKQAREQALEMLKLVGIPSPESRFDDYPHQFSGGMRQRVMIAIALACKPRLLIADEPTTALDVTIQAQVLELIAGIREKLGMSVILITHDLGVVAEYCDNVVVMYAGQIVERGPTHAVIANPQHPYTQGLLNSIPRLSDLARRIEPIKGTVPELVNLPAQCRFMDRCTRARPACKTHIAMQDCGPEREVRCLFPGTPGGGDV